MRIIAGQLSGRIFDAPRGNRTHPMSTRVMGGLFGTLGDIDGLTVLDAFSGSGALAFEALSRGAQQVVALDNDKQAAGAIRESAKTLLQSPYPELADRFEFHQMNCSVWSDQNQDKKFDIILCDPPYDDLQLSTVSKLVRHMKSSSIMVISQPGRDHVSVIQGVVVVDNRSYGDAALVFYRLDNRS